MSRTNQESNTSQSTCPCCTSPPLQMLHRRHFLSLALGGVAMAGMLLPGRSWAGSTYSTYEAVVLSCIDPRMQKPVRDYLVEHGLDGQYSQITIAGAAIGAVAPTYEAWRQAFWDNLAITLQLHQVTRVLVIDHRNCGAALDAYGPHRTQDGETRLHKRVMEELRQQIHQRHPQLCVDNLLMDLEGTAEEFPDPNCKKPS